jgi:orotidine-5'-phosphate decarboxylase
MMQRFGVRLRQAMDERGALCVGIDPHPQLLAAWGLPDSPQGLRQFSETVVEAIGDRVAVVKPQSAFFERHGAAGVAILESTIRQLRAAGALALVDVKRGDIGSTVVAYAEAYLDPRRPLAADAVTVNPFLGFGALLPVIDMARSNGAGVFVLALTSNPEAAAIQRARIPDGRTVGQLIVDEVAQVNAGIDGFGDIGVVIGATVDLTGHDLTKLGGPVLAPGLGAQGGRAEDLARIFGDQVGAVLPAYSREILMHGPGVAALRRATAEILAKCRAATA